MNSDSGIIFETDTQFAHYEVVDAVYSGRSARLLYSGNKQAAQSGLALDGKPELLFDYNERFMELVRGLLPQRILVIGGGAFTLPRAVLEELPRTRLTVVELDPALPEIAKNYFGFKPGRHTVVHVGDGAEFLAAAGEQYDLIIIDAFSHALVPQPLQTPAFAALLRNHVRRGGVVAMNLISSYSGPRSAVLRRQITAFKTAFRALELFPAGREASLLMPQNFVLTAQNGTRELQPLLLYPPLALPVVTVL